MKRILVTGANKGIGKAIVAAILDQHEDTSVLLGSRDEARGRSAVDGLVAAHPGWAERLSLLRLDVSDDASVEAAAAAVAEHHGATALYGLVNNAGLGLGASSARAILDVNTLGLRRVSEAFLPLIDPAGGRVVNVTSGAGPVFVAACSAERQRSFVEADTSWDAVAGLVEEFLALAGDKAACDAAGFGDGNPYGFSKACANLYTLMLARAHPELLVNACTPGFIETDLARYYVTSLNKTPAELGMKSPAEGARTPLHLLFASLEGNGRYYGSDAKRSPLDRYRSPGDPEYTGDP